MFDMFGLKNEVGDRIAVFSHMKWNNLFMVKG